MEQIEHIQLAADWLPAILQKASNWREPSHFDRYAGDILPLTDEIFVLKGSCPEHTDSMLPSWSAILVLRAHKATLTATKKEPLELRPGMLLALNIHHRHQLVQADKDVFMFAALDYKRRPVLHTTIERFKNLGWQFEAGTVL
jgi:hypothetical protein